MKPFDLLSSPLTGTNLIEASAGTGKTYTIASLFLRLLLEKHLTVDQIRQRVRDRDADEILPRRHRLLSARESGDCHQRHQTDDHATHHELTPCVLSLRSDLVREIGVDEVLSTVSPSADDLGPVVHRVEVKLKLTVI